MKRNYEKPFIDRVEMTEKYGVMQAENSGELGGGGAWAKQNTWEETLDNSESNIFSGEKKNNLWDE
ncbi:MAG: hypothetical protein IKH86_03925 [Prevotella sp.]|nr:hypothetical protein [Prevotella sp.]